jgi:acyl-coenzyme A synthetase/AMP-(fatty) acid ligase
MQELLAVESLPIVGHRSPAQPMAWRAGRAISVAEFVADVMGLAAALPEGCDILNLCQDRYRFTVTFAAALVAGRVSLLAQNQAERTLEQIVAAHPGCIAIAEAPVAGCPVPMRLFDEAFVPAGKPAKVPEIPADRIAALVFTSGSTGVPKANYKRWGRLVRGAHAECRALGLQAPFHVLGTVPPQHMYGFESTVLLPLLTGGVLHADRPLFARDVQAALEALPAPRVLVTAPIHIRACVDDALAFPPMALIVSAAAPLAVALARRAESKFGARVVEIYGFTEAGQVAVRQTTATANWETMPDIRLVQSEGRWAFAGGHVHGVQIASDKIEALGDTAFALGGREQDLVNVVGKRASLADLNVKLNEIPGVEDGAFHVPSAADGAEVRRLMAFVVAPTLSERQILQALRTRMDSAFLPRPLVKVAALPRSATGKVTLEILRQLEAEARARR